jgi:hypothetical protein
MTVLTSPPPPKTASTDCCAGSSGVCSSEAETARHLSWPATLALVAAGAALCLLIVALFGA